MKVEQGEGRRAVREDDAGKGRGGRMEGQWREYGWRVCEGVGRSGAEEGTKVYRGSEDGGFEYDGGSQGGEFVRMGEACFNVASMSPPSCPPAPSVEVPRKTSHSIALLRLCCFFRAVQGSLYGPSIFAVFLSATSYDELERSIFDLIREGTL